MTEDTTSITKTETGTETANTETVSLAFDTWIKDQTDPVKSMMDTHTKGLKTALDSERESRKKLEKDLRDMAGKAEKGSEAEKQLTEMVNKISESDRRADFYEAAHAAGVTNLKLAFIVASQDDLFDRRGAVNFETMKQSYPELFGTAKVKPPAGNAGDGNNNNNPPGHTMNDYIRTAAGRK